MPQSALEERVTRLEQLYDEWLRKRSVAGEPDRDDWLKSVGMFAGDPLMKEILEEGRRIREEDRQRTAGDC